MVIVDNSPDDRAEARRLLLQGSDRCYAFIEAEAEIGAARPRLRRQGLVDIASAVAGGRERERAVGDGPRAAATNRRCSG